MSTGLRKRIDNWLKCIQFLCLPGTCIQCRRHSHRQRDLCLQCQAALPRICLPCTRCGLPLPPGSGSGTECGACLSRPPPFIRLISPYAYEPPVSALITAFKFHGRLVNGRVLGELLGATLRSRYQDGHWPHLLVPAPLHKRRLRQRGFNQALEIARILSRELGIPIAGNLLSRHQHTLPQTELSARQRQQNLKGAFILTPQPQFSPGMRVAIIDDVVTTGATATELATLLLKAGAGEVHVWALARTCN